MGTSRESIQKIVTPWMRGWVGSRFLFAIAAQLDALATDAIQGIGARYAAGPPPKLGALRTPEALPLLGRDRGILRGFAESDASHIERLQRYLDDYPRAGNAYALMEQVRGYLSPHAPRLRVVNDGNAWRTINVDGSKEYARASPANWNWSNEPAKVSRCWLVIYPPFGLWQAGPTVGDAALWSGAIGTPGYTIGSTATPDQLQDLRSIIATFKGAASKYEAIVLAFDAASFDPAAAPGAAGMPSGTWGDGIDHNGVPAGATRLNTARYIRGY